MTQIRCLPDDLTVTATPGTTLLEALVARDIPIARACGGNARCSTCRVRVEAGVGAFAPPEAEERAMAERLGFGPDLRLACRARPAGDATVRRLVLDEEDERVTSQIASEPYDGAVGHERPVAILFADVNGFTAMSETLPAYDVIHLLNRWFHRAGGAVAAEGGRVDNFMGDGLLALFGADGAPDPAMRGVRAGLALLTEADRMAEYLARGFNREFGIRVGLHHGPVVVGKLGACGRGRETAIGDAVNRASRIQDANKEAGTRFLISESAFGNVRDRVRVGKRFPLRLRGATGVHELYEIIGTT